MKARTICLAVLGVLLAVVVHAQEAEPPAAADAVSAAVAPDVRTDRPRIWFTPERLEFLKKKWRSEPLRIRDNDAEGRALRYVLAGDEADARFAIDYILNFDVSEEVLTQKVASDQYRWGAFVPIIYDWCSDKMTTEEKEKFLARYGYIADMINRKSWGGPGMPGSNYYSGYMRNSGIFGLAAWGETPFAAKVLDDALVARWRNSSLPYYNTEAKGGVIGEGTQYDRYNIGYIIALAEAVKSATGWAPADAAEGTPERGRNLYRETNWFREWVYQTIYSTTPAATFSRGNEEVYYQRFPFGDDEFNQGHPTVDDYIGDSLRALALEYADEAVGRHAAAYLERVDPALGTLGWVVEDGRGVEAGKLSDLPPDYFAPGAGFACVRSGWAGDATAIMLQMGFGSKCSHHHLDLGSFQIARGGGWLSKESTGYGHTFKGTTSREAAAHNTVLFDGRGQANAYLDGPPKVLALRAQEKYFHAVVDVTDAYRARKSSHLDRDDNPGAGPCVREFVFIRPDLLIVFDRMTSTAPEVKKTFVLHFPEKPERAEEGWFKYTSKGSQLVAQFVYPKELSFEVVDEGDFEGKKGGPGYYQWRLEASQSGALDGYFLTVIAAQERFDLEPRCELVETDDTIGVQVRQPGRRTEVHFQKAVSGNFGHLVVEAAGAHGWLETDLAEGVQAITVDASGVHWGE